MSYPREQQKAYQREWKRRWRQKHGIPVREFRNHPSAHPHNGPIASAPRPSIWTIKNVTATPTKPTLPMFIARTVHFEPIPRPYSTDRHEYWVVAKNVILSDGGPLAVGVYKGANAFRHASMHARRLNTHFRALSELLPKFVIDYRLDEAQMDYLFV